MNTSKNISKSAKNNSKTMAYMPTSLHDFVLDGSYLEKESFLHFCMEFLHIIPKSFNAIVHKNQSLENCNNLYSKGVVIFNTNGSLVPEITDIVWQIITEEYTINGAKWQNTLHKDWQTVKDSDEIDLIKTQLLHYFSTYGLENMGFPAMPFIPTEKAFEDCALKPNFESFTVFHVVEDSVAIEKATEYLCSIVAPKNNWVDAMEVALGVLEINPDDLKSFELKILRYNQLGIVPQNGQDWVRYIIYLVTGSPLMVKDKKTFKAIQNRHVGEAPGYYYNYLVKISEVELAKVFFRYKPFFMAMRVDHYARPIINRVRKLAEKHHTTFNEINVQNVANLIMQGKTDKVYNILSSCTTRQLIKLINYFKQEIYSNFSTPEDGSFNRVYTIRNGKLFVRTDASVSSEKSYQIILYYNYAYTELITRFKDKFKGKTFFIPTYVYYSAPVSEKQFVGNIPWGTYFNIPAKEYFNIAIYWKNQKFNDGSTTRTDLDFHLQSLTASYGWNSGWRDNLGNVLYSGDVTDATNGAVETYRFASNNDEEFLATVNNYTSHPGAEFKLFIAETPAVKNGYNCPIVNVSKALFPPVKMAFGEDNAMTLGMIFNHNFYFYSGKLGMDIVPKKELYKNFIHGIQMKLKAMMPLTDIISASGAKIISENSLRGLTKEEVSAIMQDVVDLSPSNLTADVLLKIVDAGDEIKAES